MFFLLGDDGDIQVADINYSCLDPLYRYSYFLKTVLFRVMRLKQNCLSSFENVAVLFLDDLYLSSVCHI
jgi:hypothetical protein